MPIKKAAKKYMRVSSSNQSRNNIKRKTLRLAVRKVLDLLKEEKIEEARKAFLMAQKAIDKAAKAGIIKANTAARKKSRLVKKIKQQQKN